MHTIPYLLVGHQSSLSAFLVRAYLHNIYSTVYILTLYIIIIYHRYHIGFVGITRTRGNIVFFHYQPTLYYYYYYYTNGNSDSERLNGIPSTGAILVYIMYIQVPPIPATGTCRRINVSHIILNFIPRGAYYYNIVVTARCLVDTCLYFIPLCAICKRQ